MKILNLELDEKFVAKEDASFSSYSLLMAICTCNHFIDKPLCRNEFFYIRFQNREKWNIVSFRLILKVVNTGHRDLILHELVGLYKICTYIKYRIFLSETWV